MAYPILKKSADAWASHQGNRTGINNPGLIFHRFIPKWVEDKEATQIRKNGDQASTKKDGLDLVVESAKKADLQLLKAMNTRWQMAAGFSSAKLFSLATQWRMVAGFGAKGPLEVGFSFDRCGFPTLPGSSLKGVARAMARYDLLTELAIPALSPSTLDEVLLKPEIDPKDPKKHLFLDAWRQMAPNASAANFQLACDFRTIFGTQEQSGKAIFLDAIPDGSTLPLLELDVMTPHYPVYYAGKEPPTDSQSPVPIPFLTVGSKVVFHFAVGWRSNGELTVQECDLRDHAAEWLRNGLMMLGAGAKTNAGYGLFDLLSETVMPLNMPLQPQVPAPPVEPPKPQGPITQHKGKVVRMHSDQHRGVIQEAGTNIEYRFEFAACEPKGWTPGQKAEVHFSVQDGKVIKVSR